MLSNIKEKSMGGLLGILGLVFSLVGFVCTILILVAAFQEEVLQGILCLCCPFYILYYAVAKFEHEKKGLIIGGWLGGGILGAVCQAMAASAAAGG